MYTKLCLQSGCLLNYSTLYQRTNVCWPSGRLARLFSMCPKVADSELLKSLLRFENSSRIDGSGHLEGVWKMKNNAIFPRLVVGRDSTRIVAGKRGLPIELQRGALHSPAQPPFPFHFKEIWDLSH